MRRPRATTVVLVVFGTMYFALAAGDSAGWWRVPRHLMPVLACAAMVLLLGIGVREVRLYVIERTRKEKGQCPRCGYDRAGLAVGSRCPECGGR